MFVENGNGFSADILVMVKVPDADIKGWLNYFKDYETGFFVLAIPLARIIGKNPRADSIMIYFLRRGIRYDSYIHKGNVFVRGRAGIE